MGYAISGVLNQMTLAQPSSNHVTRKNLKSNFSKFKIDQWHLVAFFSWKIISVETWYKTYNQELLAIIEVFKTWHHYLENCKYKVFVLTDHNNLH